MNSQRIVTGAFIAILLTVSLVGASEKLGHIATPINAVKTFEAKRCVRCHLIDVSWEAYGPDLARASLSGNFSDIVGRMWNKAPVMLKKMNELGIEFPTMQADDLIRVASFVGVYQNMLSNYTKDADIEHGATLFHRTKCATCHDSKRMQGSFESPMLALVAMWKHQQSMRAKSPRAHVKWNNFTESDVKDLLGFLTDDESQDKGRTAPQFLKPGDAQLGKQSFVKLNCGSCHDGAGVSKHKPGGSEVVASNGRLEIGSVMAALWNHSSQMWRNSNMRPTFTAQTLADLTAYWYSERFEHCNDDTTSGESLFETKSCASCHEIGSADFTIPDNKDELLAQMWSHVPDMVEECTDNDISWPHMQPGELSAIAEYLIVSGRQNSQ